MNNKRRYGKKDSLSTKERSEHMARIRSTGNRSTELKFERALVKEQIKGWVKQPKRIPGNPDFYFQRIRLAIFVNGCFWHGCSRCARNTPRHRRYFWIKKIIKNKQRDRNVSRLLLRNGYHYHHIWEHQLKQMSWLTRLRNHIKRLQ